MKVVKVVSISAVSLASLAVAMFFLIGYFKPEPGGILVDASPPASVYVNGSLVGTTPYQGLYRAGEISLKLVPNVLDATLVPYEINVTLVPEIQTVVRREFAKSEEESSGDVISFEKEGGSEAGLIVISTPENAQISIDGVPQGFTPYKISAISPLQHQITVKAPGYVDRVMMIKTMIGYRLTVFAQLAKSGLEETGLTGPVPGSSPSPPQTYVRIGNTPTGFLRVRTQPGIKGEEIAQVKPGSTYPYIDEDVATGWLEIQYEASASGLPGGVMGWVSGQFAKKITEPSASTPSASPSVEP